MDRKGWGPELQVPQAQGIALPDRKELPIWLLGVVVGCTCVPGDTVCRRKQIHFSQQNATSHRTQQAFPLSLALCWRLRLEMILLLTEESLTCLVL